MVYWKLGYLNLVLKKQTNKTGKRDSDVEREKKNQSV